MFKSITVVSLAKLEGRVVQSGVEKFCFFSFDNEGGIEWLVKMVEFGRGVKLANAAKLGGMFSMLAAFPVRLPAEISRVLLDVCEREVVGPEKKVFWAEKFGFEAEGFDFSTWGFDSSAWKFDSSAWRFVSTTWKVVFPAFSTEELLFSTGGLLFSD